MTDKSIQMKGRLFITFDIETVTGLSIGGTDTKTEIGGVDKPVIRDPLTNCPYIPGSSLKGKIRSLLEKYYGLEINYPPNQKTFHTCLKAEDYVKCTVCQVFGISGEKDYATPTRLVVRDIHLSRGSAEALDESGRTDLPYTEVKTEVAIDRVTSAANPRQMERVPAGTVFGGEEHPAEMVYSIYHGDNCDAGKDIDRLSVLVEGLQLLEDDYLGGLGSRGSGKVRLKNIEATIRSDSLAESKSLGKYPTLKDMKEALKELLPNIRAELKVT
ncbi:MAG: type III-A CRISPR-associated RAMP protein Csm3 [Chloroflexota bacterium]